MVAGSDSTAVALRTTWFNLLKNPSTMHQLYNELIEAEKSNALTRPFPKWNEVSKLAYLDACVNEAVRLHPPFNLPLERVVPEGGATIGGKYLPGGTVIGMSPWVINRNRRVFGEDADSWRPERWLGDEEHHRKLEQSILSVSSNSK
jgi:cytochrome P450